MKNLSINKTVIGVDLGGTSVSAGRIENGVVVKETLNSVPADATDPNVVLDVVLKTIDSVFTDNVEGIGVGVPGLVDRQKGVVFDLQNIPSWKEVNLKDVLEEKFNVQAKIDNDANCFAIGEKHFGNNKNTDNIVGLTLGTGLGGGIISDGELLPDLNCGSGEFGMVPYLDATYEDYCSGKFFKTKYDKDGVEIFRQASEGEESALEAYCEFGRHMGNMLKMVTYVVDPEKIVLGGSIVKAREYFYEAMMKEFSDRVISPNQKEIIIEFSELKNAAILGAGALVVN